MSIEGVPEHVSVEADDALMAALKVKMEYPHAMITYARKGNERGDQRHPSTEIDDETVG